MKRYPWINYVLLALFYLSLALLVFFFYNKSQFIDDFLIDNTLESDFEGNDWIEWENTENGVIARSVHPLVRYKSLGIFKNTKIHDIKPGDKLVDIVVPGEKDIKVFNAETLDLISRATKPGRFILVRVQQPSNIDGNLFYRNESRDPILFINAFRLPFSFNSNGLYWQISLWIAGLGAFISLIMLFILLPLMQGNFLKYRPTLILILCGLLFFLLQLIHNLYLIVQSDFPNVVLEKVFITIYVALLIAYLLNYFFIKSYFKSYKVVIPSLLVGLWFLYQFIDIIFFRRQLRFYHDLIEQTMMLYFYIHILGGTLIFIARRFIIKQPLAVRNFIALILAAIISSGSIYYFIWGIRFHPISGEHDRGIYHLMLFFPLVNTAILQLQFGKVILVVTRSIQYLVFIIVSIALYLLISQLYAYWLLSNPYQRFLEFGTFLVTILAIRQIYVSNESKVRKFFITAQQEKTKNFRTFIARIPQYTSTRLLRKDLVDQLIHYFNADAVHIWWHEDTTDSINNPDMPDDQYERIYRELTTDNQSVWSRNKEIASFRLSIDLEEVVLKSSYSLINPITASEDLYALLMLGKKRRGVYNLADLELISQLIQQTQLTLNVLQLITREKELIQQKYQADLMALRSQINPHFLFNTLNSLTELVHESPERAEDAIEKLSFIFRYTTKESNRNLVPLKNEIKLVSTYLELEKIRFGERLTFEINIQSDVIDTEIPAFVLQTLVENCIKHGISKVLHPGIVKIEGFSEDGYLVVTVIDNGPGIDLTRIYKSTGLSNTIKRFENIYGIKNLLYFENTGDGTLVKVKVPLTTPQKVK